MSAEIGDPARELPPIIGVLLFLLVAWWQVRRIARERPPKDPPHEGNGDGCEQLPPPRPSAIP